MPPEPVLSLLARARTGIWSESRLVGAYISDPARFIELASDAEQGAVRIAVQTAQSDRREIADAPLDVLTAANRDRYENERQADPLCGAKCWRITEVWSTWDHEDIRLH